MSWGLLNDESSALIDPAVWSYVQLCGFFASLPRVMLSALLRLTLPTRRRNSSGDLAGRQAKMAGLRQTPRPLRGRLLVSSWRVTRFLRKQRPLLLRRCRTRALLRLPRRPSSLCRHCLRHLSLIDGLQPCFSRFSLCDQLRKTNATRTRGPCCSPALTSFRVSRRSFSECSVPRLHQRSRGPTVQLVSRKIVPRCLSKSLAR